MTSAEIIHEIISKSLLLKIGQRTVVRIKLRTSKGIFQDGKANYSINPFAMPIGGVQKSGLRKQIIEGEFGEDEVQLFTTKAKKLWVVLKKGYKWLRDQSGKQSNYVDMRWSSKLMRNLKVVDINVETGEIIIDHTDERNKALALYHNELGAGKSKKLHKYLYVTEQELQEIVSGI